MKQNCICGEQKEQKLHEYNIKMKGVSIFSSLCSVSLHMLPPFIALPRHFSFMPRVTLQYCCLHGAILCIVCICLVLSLEKKCKDTLHAMRCKMGHLTDLDIQKKTKVATAIEKWDEYSFKLKEHEVQFQVCV